MLSKMLLKEAVIPCLKFLMPQPQALGPVADLAERRSTIYSKPTCKQESSRQAQGIQKQNSGLKNN